MATLFCPQVSCRHADVPAVQQGLDQREDLCPAAPPGSAVVKVKPLDWLDESGQRAIAVFNQ